MNVIDTKERHDEYEHAPAFNRMAIDAAYRACVSVLRESGFTCAGDDRAEELIAAIYHYTQTSEER